MNETKKRGGPERTPDLKGYKEEILPVNRGRVTLQRDLYFLGTTQRGYEVEYDVRYEEGCSPTETLLLSVAGCLSIDIVHILRKMRCEIDRYEMTIEGARNLDPPQYYKSFEMTVQLSGNGITPGKIERAISLSREKYCSVVHSLRKDIEVSIRYRIEEPEGGVEA
ncbi:MAG: OsmC family protein [Deltaproteobacteria bacterium]|nr:OsmC family protein [Deltaproteobacteria bacterium]